MLRKFIYLTILLLGGSWMASAQTQHQDFGLSIEKEGNRPFLGIMSEKVSKEKAEKLGFENLYGSYVSSVIKNTAADKAGIRPFDYIYGIDGEQTSRTVSLGDLLGRYEPGDKIDILIIRDGKKQQVKATLGTREDADYSSAKTEKAFFGVSPSYATETNCDGAPITVVSGSSAEGLGLEDGDIIFEFNGHKILDWTDLTIAIDNTGGGQPIKVAYIRGDDADRVSGIMGSQNDRREYKEQAILAPVVPKKDKAFLGVVSDRISSDKVQKMGLDNPYGYYVTEVVYGSAAHAAGVQTMDYIYGIDEYRVGEQVGLGAILRKYQPGDQATIHLVRKGKAQSMNLRFTSKEDTKKDKQKTKKRNACEKPFMGIMQSYDEDPDEVNGVQVNIVENSSAQSAGLEDGDVITSINGYRMVDWEDITMVLNELSPGDQLNMEYERYGNNRKASTKLKSYAETKGCEDCDCGNKGSVGIDIDIDTDELEDDLEELGEDLEQLGEDLGDMIRIRRRGYDVATTDVSSYEIAIGEADSAELNEYNQNTGSGLSTRQDLQIRTMRIAAYPEDQQFRLAFELSSQGDTMVEIYNQEGRRIYQYEASSFSGPFEDAVNIGQNGAGDYYLHIEQGDRSAVRRIRLTQK